MIMRSTNNHIGSQSQNLQARQERAQRGPFKGRRTKAVKAKKETESVPIHPVHDDLDITNSPRRQDEFLPNPRILDSPGGSSGTPPKKAWEGAYKNFLSLGKSSSPHDSDLSRSPDVKKSNFTILPGTKRLVTQAPPQTVNRGSVSGMGTMKSARSTGRIHGMTGMEDENSRRAEGGDSDARPPSFLRAVFHRSTSDGSALSRRGRNYSNSSSPDDLDSAMRNGMNKHSPDYTYDSRKQASPPLPSIRHMRASSQEDSPAGLDALLAGASISPHYSVEMAGVSRATSYGGMLHTMAEGVENMPSSYPYYLPKRESTGSFNHSQAGLPLEDDSNENSSNSSSHHRSRSSDQNTRGNVFTQRQGSGAGSLLAQQVAAHAERELDQQHHHHQPMHPQNVQFQAGQLGFYHNEIDGRSGTVIKVSPPEVVGGTEAIIQDPRFPVGTSPTGMMYLQGGGSSPRGVNPDMKKLFTAFHNQARFARDATSPFLGGGSPSPIIGHDSYVAYHMMMGGGGISMPYQACSVTDLPTMGHFSSSLPLETVDENNISIHKSMRLLKPIGGTEKWESGRRYLIAPAALAACPLSVINRLSGGLVQTAQEAAESPTPQAFGMIDLGECLMTYIGETRHLSPGQWASCRLVLRQNYLLEFDASAPITGLPRGYVHLQHAQASMHGDFQNALELDFYASPCAKADRRLLMIRAETREQCAHWIQCLNRAANLKIEDLWDYDGKLEFGRGRYAAVYPARRKTESFFDNRSHVDDTDTPVDRKAALAEYSCALKIVDKAEFWRRVVKGRERADTLVREASVQAALTAKCGKLGTFLQIRGFFETSENVVIELELLEGTDLFKHISSKGVLKEHEAALILRDILTSLDAMNRAGLAHRDIKPANILISEREKSGISVKVGDFGMSTFVGVDGQARGRCGTPGYVAPEILTGGSRAGYGNEVDVFSAGVALYVMLCGYEPFYGENERDLIEANKRAKIEFPGEDWDRISNDARDLVLKMTNVDPRQRISTKEALQHPWITRLDGGEMPKSSSDRHVTLAAGDVPAEGACVVS